MRRAVFWSLLVSLGAAFIGVFAFVLELRFSDGDIYPYYATTRSDPLGASALYEAFDRLEGVSVEANLEPLMRLRDLDEESTLLLLGLPREDYEDLRTGGDSPVLEAVKEKGARLVITLHPELVPERFSRKKTEEEEDWLERRRELRDRKIREERGEEREGEEDEKDVKEEKQEKNRKGDADGESGGDEGDEDSEDSEDSDLSDEEKELESRMNKALGRPLYRVLGAEIADVKDFERPLEGWETGRGRSIDPGGVPAALPFWYSQFRFENLAPAWRVAVSVEEDPVVIERRYGKGSVVLATDSYFASNEALHLGGDPEFLLWLVGGKSRVVFDETIHGSQVTGGAMKLIRRYRLQGGFFGLFVLVGLWVWRSSSSLAPADESIEWGFAEGTSVAGEQADAGLIRLLRRTVPARQLIDQCLRAFREGARVAISSEQEKAIASAIEDHRQRPRDHGAVETYRRIAEILRKR